MEDILRRRHEAARLLDFGNFAEYALATRMAHSVAEVLKFLHELAGAARAAAQAEFAELEAFAGRKLAAWDVGFYSERLQRERFNVSQEELRPYFPLPRVLAGLFEVAERLFGVRISERQRRPGVARGRAPVRHRRCPRGGGRQLLPGCLRAPAQAQRRVDGRVRRAQAPGHRCGPAGRLPGMQLPAPRGVASRRCSPTMTC